MMKTGNNYYFPLAIGLLLVINTTSDTSPQRPDLPARPPVHQTALISPLHAAAGRCNLTAIKILVEQEGADMTAKDSFGRTPTYTAVEANCLAALTYFLDRGAKVNQGENNRRSLLHAAAARNNSVQVLSLLLDRGARLEARNKEGATPLHAALKPLGINRYRQRNGLKYLIEARGANVHTKSGNGNTLLHAAVLEQVELPFVEYLVQSGVDPNVRNKEGKTALELSDEAGSPVQSYLEKVEKNPSGFTTTTTAAPPPPPPGSPPPVPLEYKYMSWKEAILGGIVGALRYRVSVGDNPSSQLEQEDLIPIHFATEVGSLPVVKYLVEEAGVDVNSFDPHHHRTPILTGARSRSPELVRYLVSHGADLSARGAHGETALHTAVPTSSLEVVQALVEGGADVNAKNKEGRSPLHKATSKESSVPIIHYLVEHGGADLNARDKNGDTFLGGIALHADKFKDVVGLLKYAIGAGASATTRNNKGKSLLHIGARSPLLRLYKFLVEEEGGGGLGLEVNGKDNGGNSPLHDIAGGFGIWEQRNQVIRYLIEKAGADRNAKNMEGKKPVDLYVLGLDEGVRRLLAPVVDQEEVTETNYYKPFEIRNVSISPVPLNPKGVPFWLDDISLSEAVEMGSLEAVKYRISVAGDNATEEVKAPYIPYPQPSAVHVAAASGELAILKYFVEEGGAPFDAASWSGETPLTLAAKGCHLDVIQYLVEEKGADVNPKRSRITPAFAAKGFACVKSLRYLLEKGAEPLEQQKGAESLLHAAARENSVQKIAVLLDREAVPLDAIGRGGLSPLHAAVQQGAVNAAKYLIARGADPRTKSDDGDSLLHTALRSAALRKEGDDLSQVQYLVEAGVDPNARNRRNNVTALKLVDFWCNVDCPLREYLEKVEANPSEFITTTTTTTAAPAPGSPPPHPPHVPLEYKYMGLVEAIGSENLDAVRFRVSAGDNISSTYGRNTFEEGYGLTPVQLACQTGNLSILEYLVEEAGANVVTTTRGGNRHETPLHTCAKAGKKSAAARLLRYLVSRGGDPRARDQYGATPLHQATQGAYLEPVEYLVGIGADVNVKDGTGLSPLHWAALKCPLHIASFLVEQAAADIHARDDAGDTPLANAVFASSTCRGGGNSTLKLIKYLVGKGADITTRNNKGQSLLHLAANSMEPKVFEFLIKSGGGGGGLDVNGKDKDGNTPLHDVSVKVDVARDKKAAVIKILVDSGAVDQQQSAQIDSGGGPKQFCSAWVTVDCIPYPSRSSGY